MKLLFIALSKPARRS